MADFSAVADKQLFECVKIFEVQESSPVAGGETPFNSIDVSPQSSASTTIVHCSFKETRNYTALVLVCDNGYIVIRLEPFLQPPIVKQLKWYEGRDQHILDITFDPLGEWLACACLDGCIYLLPVLPLILPDCSPTHKVGPLTDIAMVSPNRKISPPTSIVWWESMDGGQICIVGSELGEITFFDLYDGRECGYLSMRGCVDQLLLAKRPDHTTHLLINLRGGEWWWMLLEERHHEEAGTSYSDVQESGFEVLLDDVVLRSFLHKPDSPQFEAKLFQGFNEITKLSTQETGNQHMLGALNLKNHEFELFSYDFELFSQCLFKFKIPFNTTSVLWTDKLLFTVNHNDESDELSFTLSIISSELAQRNTFQFPDNAVVQQFVLHSEASIIGFFSTVLETPGFAKESRDFVTPTNLNGCIIVTSDAVYCCRQMCSPESKFLKIALSTTNLQLTDELAVTFKLDICTLYKVAAEEQIKSGNYNKALRLFEQSKCPALTVMSSFVHADRYKELLSFLLSMLYDEESQTLISQSKHLQDILIQCLIHQTLSSTDSPSKSAYKEHLSQFINDKFLYNHSLTMETLIRSGMQTQLFELAQTHGKIRESIEMLIEHGSTELDTPLQSVIATGQFAEVLAHFSQGLLLCMLSPLNFAKCVLSKPSILEMHLSHLLSIHRDLDAMTLTRLAWLLDPYHQIIHPLLQKARSTIKRSNSTGSIVSTVSNDGPLESVNEYTGPSFEAYIEAFILIVTTLNNKRKHLPQPSCGLLAQSPMAGKVGAREDKQFRPLTSFSDGSQVLHGSILSCGLNHGAIVIKGDLYTWGNTRNGKLGHGDIEQQPIAAPLKVETLSMLNAKVISVSCGAEHTVALCQEGVYSWGSSTHGQLGVGDTLKRTRPVPIPSFSNITVVNVVCGQYHCLALDEDHRVWSWGWGIHGQTGTNTTDDLLVPVHAQCMDRLKVSYLAAGFNHSAVIDHKGQLYTFGNAMYGQLGHGSQDKKTTPTLVQTLADKYVYLVACGNSHTLAVCKDQSIYYWGKNFHKPHPGSSPQSLRQYARTRREGAISPAVQNATYPVPLQDTEIDDVIVQIDCGNYHCLLLSALGTVYTWGNNMHGQIGHTHTPELSQPRLVSKLEGHVIKTAACGDEFSIAIDDGGISWVWGRDEVGQLGMEFPQGVRERRKVCIFAPNPNPQIPKIITLDNHKETNINNDATDNTSLLAIDLQWNLPDFANIGSSDTPYSVDCIQSVLHSLHGYYRSGTVMNHCLHLEDYESLSILMTVERQWLEALYYKLRQFSKEREHLQQEIVLKCIKEFLTGHLDNTPDFHGREYIIRTAHLLIEIVKFWEKHELNVRELESLLTEKIKELAYPLSMILKSDNVKFSFKFSLAITVAITNQISLGIPPLEQLVLHSASDMENQALVTKETDSVPTPESSYKKHSLQSTTLSSDSRLWTEVLRNLSKNIHQHSVLTIPESELVSIKNFREKNLKTSDKDILSRKDGIIAFSCGHAFSEIQFQEKILIEFLERVSDFLSTKPHMVVFMQQYFKQSSTYTSGCPYCVFQYLRTSELKKNPNVPIRPWSYY